MRRKHVDNATYDDLERRVRELEADVALLWKLERIDHEMKTERLAILRKTIKDVE